MKNNEMTRREMLKGSAAVAAVVPTFLTSFPSGVQATPVTEGQKTPLVGSRNVTGPKTARRWSQK